MLIPSLVEDVRVARLVFCRSGMAQRGDLESFDRAVAVSSSQVSSLAARGKALQLPVDTSWVFTWTLRDFIPP